MEVRETIRKMAEDAGLQMGQRCDKKTFMLHVGTVRLPRELARELDHQSTFRFCPVRAEHVWRGLDRHEVNLTSRLGSVEAARRFLLLLQDMAVVQD